MQKYESIIDSIAISLPGRNDTEKGIAHTLGVYMFVKDFPIVAKLNEHLDVPITIANDAKCAAKAEAWSGALSDVDGVEFFKAYDKKEQEAINALDKFGRFTAAGIYSIQSILDVEKIAIGGGISEREEITEIIKNHVDKLWGKIPFIPFSKPEVVTCKYRNDANLIGALSIHLDRQQR